MDVIAHFSPNHDARPEGAEIELLILHYTGMESGEAALSRLCDPAAKVSAHYVIEEDGRIFQLVDEEQRAWHAGVSHWRGEEGLNARSIGIEIVNPGHEFGYRDFPAPQMEAVAQLCRDILARRPEIEPRHVLAHSDIAPDRKEDPGERFEWAWLAGQGVGLWPEASETADYVVQRYGMQSPEIATTRRRLAAYGYPVAPGEKFDVALAKVVMAFQRHFRPTRLSGEWDGECDARLAALLAMV